MNPFVWGSWTAPLLDHLWQSTVFAAGVWLLAFALRRNAARLRYRLWMAASLKFLLPFSLLMALGARLPWPAHLARTQPVLAVAGVAQPLLQVWPAESGPNPPLIAARTNAAATPAPIHWLPFVLLAVWVAGTLLLLARWISHWLRLRSVVRRGRPVTLADGTPARLTTEHLEPGVFGIVRPVLVLPCGIAERLSPDQLRAVIAHEQSHVRRHDNCTAALHMAVEALFWFHPMVWWLQVRLVAERERACDEAVLDATRQPVAYAEGILHVCRFYVEAPLSCVSGVTGAELKQRIARILSPQAVRSLDLRRKVLLALACLLALGVPVTTGLVRAAQGQTPSPASQKIVVAGTGIAGAWQGTAHLPNGRDLRMVMKIARDDKGALTATLYRVDPNPQPNNVFQDGPPLVADSVSFSGGTLRFVNTFPGMTYEGKMSADGNAIAGTVTQNGSFPLTLERATPANEWTLPAPPPRIPPMAPDAKPAFEVATIKPAAPDSRRMGFRMRGGELSIQNLSLEDILKFVFQVQSREIAGEPGWMSADKWDIEAKPDTPGTPSSDQLRAMMQKLLADRFALQFHEEKREMAAYVLTVGKDGPKLMKSASASQMGGFTMGPLGVMHAGGATMAAFVGILQSDILDRPVVDRTGLQGRWDFTLKWAPDETQFAGVKAPRPPEDETDPLPPLFTAIREQLDLQLESEKAEVPVIVVDHVQKPSPN